VVARLVRCPRCRRMFVAQPGQRLCPACAEEARSSGPWGAPRRRRAPGRSAPPWRPSPWQTWRPLAYAAGGSVLAALVVGSWAPTWAGRAAWLGFVAGMVLADRT